MIQHILLVAAREFRQIAATRSFWITLLIMPLLLAIGPIASRAMGKPDTATVMVIDQAGGRTAAAIRQRIAIDNDRQSLDTLTRYVRGRGLQRADPAAPWAQPGHYYSDAEVGRFAAAGGIDGALVTIRRASLEDADRFEKPQPLYRLVDTPLALAAAAPANLDRALAPSMRPEAGSKRKPIDYVVLVPRDFGPSPLVRLWANGAASPAAFVATLQGVLTPDLRARFLAGAGVPAATAAGANAIAPAIQVTTAAPGKGRERMVIRSLVPLACAYILIMSIILSGSWMLQATIEERSNKLIEAVLACVSPDDLMIGKLVGTVAVGMVMILAWVACGVVATYALHGPIVDMVRSAIEEMASPGNMLAILYFFLAGYLMVAMLFLAIGTFSNSMRDAQGYLMPVVMLILMPFVLLMQALLRGASGGIWIEVMTWVPLYTPFAVLARLGSGIPLWELLGSAALLAAFIVVEIALVGRAFRASLLGEGRKGLAEILGLMRRAG